MRLPISSATRPSCEHASPLRSQQAAQAHPGSAGRLPRPPWRRLLRAQHTRSRERQRPGAGGAARLDRRRSACAWPAARRARRRLAARARPRPAGWRRRALRLRPAAATRPWQSAARAGPGPARGTSPPTSPCAPTPGRGATITHLGCELTRVAVTAADAGDARPPYWHSQWGMTSLSHGKRPDRPCGLERGRCVRRCRHAAAGASASTAAASPRLPPGGGGRRVGRAGRFSSRAPGTGAGRAHGRPGPPS